MKQEDKELLLKDLCARLAYKVKASYYGAEEEMRMYDEVEGVCGDYVEIGQYSLPIEVIKPYLFPLSSMTKEQKREYHQSTSKDIDMLQDVILERINGEGNTNKHAIAYNGIDWLNAHHFDYRGLIEKSLALDATCLNIYKEGTK